MLSSLLAALILPQAPGDPSRVPQGVEYVIEASLDEGTNVLAGRAELRYTNNAAVPLDTLWFHQHLNAFRPNSAWARRELQFGNARFQNLGPAEHAFERLQGAQIGGRTVQPVYPGSPDSTVVGLPLPAPLPPRGTVVVRLDWTARPSTLPRRQGRRGRHYDFAQWYPRIAAYDEGGWQTQALLPQGEFFGEFGGYDVTLDLAADQVVGATGVPVEGDPGWAGRARPGYDDIVAQRNAYPARAAPGLGLLVRPPAAGRKRIRWRAEDVHHFAWSTDPEFVYEGGRVQRRGGDGGTIALHVLYGPGDADWANGTVVGRTAAALDWLQGIFGPYPWPQLTNLHRIESGGTEFPMLVMDGSPSEGLIVHEVAHQYMHGILANNEFDEGWLDEGFASFLTNWYFEERGNADVWNGSIESIRQLEMRGDTQPIATPGAEFRDPSIYSAMSYTKAELVLRMLRWLIGEDTLRTALREFFDRHALRQVGEEDLRAAVSDVAGEDLAWFFDQWLHTTGRLDYAVTSATTRQQSNGTWSTTVEVQREGQIWMPVELEVGESSIRLTGNERRQVVEVVTPRRPTVAVLDPESVLIEYDVANNRRAVAEP